MVELHWTRRDLLQAEPADIVAIRHALFAKSLAPTVVADFAGQRKSIEIGGMSGRQREAAELRQRREAIEHLKAAERSQVRMRELLELDVEDEPDEDAELEELV